MQSLLPSLRPLSALQLRPESCLGTCPLLCMSAKAARPSLTIGFACSCSKQSCSASLKHPSSSLLDSGSPSLESFSSPLLDSSTFSAPTSMKHWPLPVQERLAPVWDRFLNFVEQRTVSSLQTGRAERCIPTNGLRSTSSAALPPLLLACRARQPPQATTPRHVPSHR